MEASSGLGLATIERCADAWTELHARIGRRFARAEARERAGRYLAGLLERVPAQERLAAGCGGDRRDRAAGRAAPAERRHLGHRRRPR